ncbi:hypothetical protein NQ314_015108 [Rhamnusium bicolor]|uniref:Uncharacterized protein n=1 Tax=Rhamnusium bicolor TaxID=1586634 RepID=A0AAV8WZW7_9CUCU|nr:hypothetical protein NQ314_015108 [Rhamnusium bicolor]
MQDVMARFNMYGDAGDESREKVEAELRSISLEEANTRHRVVLSQDITLAPGVTGMVGVIIEDAQPGEEVYMERKVFA